MKMTPSSLFSDPSSTTPSSVLSAYHALASTLTTTTHQPFVYPYRALGPHLFVAYLLLPPTTKDKGRLTSSPLYASFVYHLRYPVFLVASALCIQAIVECRSPLVTVGYGIGIINTWSVLWMGCWMLFGDGRGARRIERPQRQGAGDRTGGEVGGAVEENHLNGNAAGIDGAAGQGLRRRGREPEGDVDGNPSEAGEKEKSHGFVWQGLPPRFLHRVDWVADLVTNFRGIRWTHQISGMPYPDSSSLSAFAEPISHQSSSPSTARPRSSRPNTYPTRSALVRSSIIAFIVNLLVLDMLKFLMLRDPYFWGVSNAGPSPYYFPRTSRLVLSVAGVYSSLLSIFLLSPIVYCGLAGEKYIGQHAWPWLYPPYYGSPVEVWRKGLAGIWGGWWHQLFRLGFEQAGDSMGRSVGWEKRSVQGGILRVVVAFICSGGIHACGSYTALGNTRPGDAFMFFALQPIGLIAQRAVAGWMKKNGVRDRIPASVRGACNLGLAVGWCWLTGPLIADDFADGGIWLYEPMPFSLTRGLAGDGWWKWGGTWMRWHTADRWWKSGIAI